MLKELFIITVVVYGVSLLFERNSEKTRYKLSYPVRLLSPVTSKVFKASLQKNNLQCFGNIDYPEPTYIQTFGCLIGIPGINCNVIWGSRSVAINIVNGSAEFFRVETIPQEVHTQSDRFSLSSNVSISSTTHMVHSNIVATRWYQDDATITKPRISSNQNNDHSSNSNDYGHNSHRNIRHVDSGSGRHGHTGFVPVNMHDSEAHAHSLQYDHGSGYPSGTGISSNGYGSSLTGSHSGSATPYSSTTVIHIAAEPIYLCGRATTWQSVTNRASSSSSSFSVPTPQDMELKSSSLVNIHFRASYTRENDKTATLKKLLLHAILIVSLSSRFVVPYVLTLMLFITLITTSVGMKIYTLVLCLSCGIVLLTPFMFTQRNKERTQLFIAYFNKLPWNSHEREEIRGMFRDTLPAFQTVYFSSLVVCIGSALAYFVYMYCGVVRGTRNLMLQYSVAVALSWCCFCCARYFEDTCRDYLWLGMSAVLYTVLDGHINSGSRDEVIVCILVLSYLVKYVFTTVLFPAMGMKRFVQWMLPSFLSSRQTDEQFVGATGTGTGTVTVTDMDADMGLGVDTRDVRASLTDNNSSPGSAMCTPADTEGVQPKSNKSLMSDNTCPSELISLQFEYNYAGDGKCTELEGGRPVSASASMTSQTGTVQIAIPSVLESSFDVSVEQAIAAMLPGGVLRCYSTSFGEAVRTGTNSNGTGSAGVRAVVADHSLMLLGWLVLHFDSVHDSLSYRDHCYPFVKYTTTPGSRSISGEVSTCLNAGLITVRLACAANKVTDSISMSDLRDVLVYVVFSEEDNSTVGTDSCVNFSASALMCDVARHLRQKEARANSESKTGSTRPRYGCKCIQICDAPSASDIQSWRRHVGLNLVPLGPADTPHLIPLPTQRITLDQKASCMHEDNYWIIEANITNAYMVINDPKMTNETAAGARTAKGRTSVSDNVKRGKVPFSAGAAVVPLTAPAPHLTSNAIREAFELFMQHPLFGSGGLSQRVSRAVRTCSTTSMVSDANTAYYLQLLLSSVRISLEFSDLNIGTDTDTTVARLTFAVPMSIVHHICTYGAVCISTRGSVCVNVGMCARSKKNCQGEKEVETQHQKLHSLMGSVIVGYLWTLYSYARIYQTTNDDDHA